MIYKPIKLKYYRNDKRYHYILITLIYELFIIDFSYVLIFK